MGNGFSLLVHVDTFLYEFDKETQKQRIINKLSDTLNAMYKGEMIFDIEEVKE